MTTNPKRSGIPLKWNLEAVNGFYEALLEHGKDFEKISIFLLKKSINRNPQKIPNHFTWMGVRCFYYRILKKASNLLHAYECRHPKAPVLAGVELRKSVLNNLIVSSSSVSPKRQLSCEQNELSKNDPTIPSASNENKPEDPDSTYSPSDFSLQELANEHNEKRDEDETNEILLDFQENTNANISIILPESEESNLTDTENTICEPNIQLYEKNCQKHSEDGYIDIEPKDKDVQKRDLTKELVRVDGLGRVSLDLIAVICYTKLYISIGEKINSRNKDVLHRVSVYLGELVYKGTTRYRNKGHTKRFKIPICKGLKSPISMGENPKLKPSIDAVTLELPTSANNSETSSDERPTSTTNIVTFQKTKSKNLSIKNSPMNNEIFSADIDANICIEFTPKDEITFKAVQSVARNPNLRVFAPPNTLFANIITILSTKWKKIFARTTDITLKFQFHNSDIAFEHLNGFSSSNVTVKDLIISQLPLPGELTYDLQGLRLKYHFQTHYEHILAEGVGTQLTPLSALVELLYTINRTENIPLHNSYKFPLGKNFPRKVAVENKDRKTKNLMTRNLLKNKLQILRHIHASKNINKNKKPPNSGKKIDQNKLKCLLSYLRSQKGRLHKSQAHRVSSKNVSKTGETQSIPSSFHSVLKQKANSRSLFSSEITENSFLPPNIAHDSYSKIENSYSDNIYDESMVNFEPFPSEALYGTVNYEFPSEYPVNTNEFGSLNTFSILADAYLGLNAGDGVDLGPSVMENFDTNCPSVVSENFQSLLCELDGMVQEWESEENTNPHVALVENNPNPAKMFLQYFLNNPHDSSEDHVMRSIFEDDSLDSLNTQHFSCLRNEDKLI